MLNVQAENKRHLVVLGYNQPLKHTVKLTVITVQYVSVVVQDGNIRAMRQTVQQQHPLTAATYSAAILWRKEILLLDVCHAAFFAPQ